MRLKRYHYIQTAATPQHWFNFYKGPLSQYIQEFKDDFCLVINCSRVYDETYILPFEDFKVLFVPASMFDKRRWQGCISGDCIKLSPVENGFEKPVHEYMNAFHLLKRAPRPLPKPVEFS